MGWRSIPTSSATWAAAAGSACARLLTWRAKSLDIRFRRRSRRGAPVTQRCWSPAQRRYARCWDGIRSTPAWKILFAPRGNGTRRTLSRAADDDAAAPLQPISSRAGADSQRSRRSVAASSLHLRQLAAASEATSAAQICDAFLQAGWIGWSIFKGATGPGGTRSAQSCNPSPEDGLPNLFNMEFLKNFYFGHVRKGLSYS